MIRYTTGTLADLTTCINTAIDDLAAPVAHADGTLASVVAQLNLLIDWTGKPVAHATGTLANAVTQYNALAAYYIHSFRLYIVPITHVVTGPGTEFAAPKYFFGRMTDGLPGMEGVKWYWERFVWENHGIIAADVSDAQHALINAQTDVIVIPALNDTIPNASTRNIVRNYLEAGNIPGTWVNTGMTYREVVRTVLNIWRFANRYVSKGGKIFAGGITLDTTWSQIPALAQQRLQETAVEFGLDTSGVTGTTTIRQILKGMADQFGAIEYKMGEIII